LKRNKIIIIVSIVVLLTSISLWNRRIDYDRFLLLSDRQAPLGWIYFTIYKDSTFEYTSRGLSDRDIYKGKAIIKKDSIFLNYYDSIPIVGKRVFYTKDYVEFVDLKNSRLKTRLNKLIE
jgi:hypothetical protein